MHQVKSQEGGGAQPPKERYLKATATVRTGIMKSMTIKERTKREKTEKGTVKKMMAKV